MDLVRLEDAVDRIRQDLCDTVWRPLQVVLSYERGREQMGHLLLDEGYKESPRAMQREIRHSRLLVGLGTYRFFQLGTFALPGFLQLSFFLLNSNFFRQPSSLRVQRREQFDSKIVDFVCEEARKLFGLVDPRNETRLVETG